MRLHHDAARFIYLLVHAAPVEAHYVFVIKKPLPVDAVDQILVAIEVKLDAEDNVEFMSFRSFVCLSKTITIQLHLLLPRQVRIDRAVIPVKPLTIM